MKKTIIIALLALIAVAGQAKTFKTIKSPVAMGHNIRGGELKAREVVMTDTATTVHFTIEYPKGQRFSINSTSYLLDEKGNRYPLCSAEGIKLNKYGESTGPKDFTLHFEPMPKQVKVFDYIEDDNTDAFKLLGIHDEKSKIKYPTIQELIKANPWKVPGDWFKTDTITIQGRIEGYDATTFGFTSMECYMEDVFEKNSTTMVLDIAPDGTFCKKFLASYPMQDSFYADDSKVDFEKMPFFARPGETIDITVRKNENGQYVCIYNNGSSRDVERWLCSSDEYRDIFRPLHFFKGKLEEGNELAEVVWQNAMYRLKIVSRRMHYTPMEIQLTLADMQAKFIESYLSYVDNYESDLVEYEERDGDWHVKILDSVEYEKIYDAKNYYLLRYIDFENPLLLAGQGFCYTFNRIQYTKPVMEVLRNDSLTESQRYDEYYAVLRQMLGTGDDTMMAQLCRYKEMVNDFNFWRNEKDYMLAHMKQHGGTPSDSIWRKALERVPSVEERFAQFLTHITHPYIRQKAEAYYASKMAETDIATPLPEDNPSAEIIRQLCAKYPGRILMIDFWGMGCGPCRGAIQSSKEKRAEIAKRNDVKLVFIAGERTAEGSDAYHKYVNEWLADEETICVTNIEFNRLQELFRFNGIPHYETITPDCRRVRDDLRIDGYYDFDNDLQMLLEKLK